MIKHSKTDASHETARLAARPASGRVRVGHPQKHRFRRVASDEPGVRVFVVQSEDRLAFERKQRVKAMGRVRAELEALQKRVADGQLISPDKIGAAARGNPQPEPRSSLL